MKWVVALVLAAACSKDEAPPPAEPPPPLLPAAEIKRAVDACKAYVDKVCACETPKAKEECTLARGVPDAIDLAKRLAANPKADPVDAKQAASSVRKTVKNCIERTAALPTEGCP